MNKKAICKQCFMELEGTTISIPEGLSQEEELNRLSIFLCETCANINQSIEDSKSISLKTYENQFILICRALGFEGKAGTQELIIKLEAMEDKVQALMIATRLLTIKDAIREYGGTWEGIPNELHEGV